MATKKKNNKAKSKKFSIKNFNYTGKYFVLTLVFAATASLLLVPTFAARGGNSNKGNKQAGPGIVLKSASNSVKNGEIFTVEVWTNSLDNLVNAVQAEITYPESKLQFVEVNSIGSAYSISAEEVATGGLIKIVRAANPAVSGNQKVATITFKAVDGNGKVNISSSSSALVSAETNTNIASSNNGVSIRLAR
jgi:hypothetical protein